MAFALSPAAVAAGHRLVAFETIGSTSVEALDRARAGEGGPLWVVSAHQSAGMGRRGQAWQTPPGNLAATLLLASDLAPARLATLGFVAGLALEAALARSCGPQTSIKIAGDEARSGRKRFTLKWPNDVLADGAKLAGILLGTEAVSPTRRAVVIGIGVNVVHVPKGLPYPTACLATVGCEADAESLFLTLSAEWVRAYDLWAGEGGFSAIRELWLARAAGLGGAVAIRTDGGVTRGTFETIDEHGQLVVQGEGGATHRISAGEVHFGAAASLRPEFTM